MPASHMIRIEDYTIGLVCALFTELAAAQDMLDERHSDSYGSSMDTNIYTLGSIAGHKVVIACLPEGQIGVGSAAEVAAQMKSTFPSIQFGLMVGVGGGVPTAENDVRLGDVVVSRPDKGHGGVVQYDLGKNTPSGFRRTGFLNSPPQILLKAIAKIRSNHLRGENKVLEYAVKMEPPGPDILFEPGSGHIGGSMCEQCDKDKVVRRKPRANQEIVVHYGTIASGSQVMKDAVERDRLSSELGGVLCFEMEAAGLMNIFPCLVIRGICDYADSHKNKAWQQYAARMAAAYAKDLLSSIPIAEVGTPRMTHNRTVHFHLLPGTGVCPFESMMTPPYFGWSAEYIATAIQIVAQVMQTLNEAKDDDGECFAETEEFLHELEATLKIIQRYESGFPSGQFTTDIIRLLQIMKSPFDRFVHFGEEYYLSLTLSPQIPKSTAGPESKKRSLECHKLSGKIMELKEAMSHPLKLVHTLLLLHSLEDVIKVIRREIPVMEPGATNVATKLIRALNSIDDTKLDLHIESLRSRQNHEKAMYFGAKSSRQDISPTPLTRGRQSRSRSGEMIFAIEVLRQELHRSTGIILDTLINEMNNPSNDLDVKGLLELHKQSFRALHESLKSSWMVTNEIQKLIRQSKEQDANMSSWTSKWADWLLGAVIGSIVTAVFGRSLKSSNQPQLCDISSLVDERDMDPSRQNKRELCSGCLHSKNRIIPENEALAVGEDSHLVRQEGQSSLRIEGPTLPSAKSSPFQPESANNRIASPLSSVYAANDLYSGPAQQTTSLPIFASLWAFTAPSSSSTSAPFGISMFGGGDRTRSNQDNKSTIQWWHCCGCNTFTKGPNCEACCHVRCFTCQDMSPGV